MVCNLEAVQWLLLWVSQNTVQTAYFLNFQVLAGDVFVKSTLKLKYDSVLVYNKSFFMP